MERKRLRNTNLLGDEEEQAATDEPEIKKFKSTSTSVPSFLPAPSESNPTQNVTPNSDQIRAMIAQKKAHLEALPSTTVTGKSDDSAKAKGGLKVEAHPALLLDQSGKLDLKQASTLIPKPNFATVKANQRLVPATVKQEPKTLKNSEDINDITQNPYYDPRAGNIAPQRLNRKRFKFIPKEKLKEEIAESVKKAGMEAELDSSDKAIKRDPPPALEWWDVPLLPNKTYDDLDVGLTKIESEDTLVTLYVQHPIPIKPPGDNSLPPPKPLILTKREQKKLRKQKRLELQKEKQDKIRLGLLPPDQAKDPTKVEAQVQDAKKAIIVCVYKVNDLSHPKMKFKVDMNAQQLGLTGTVIINPNFSVIIVEGGPKSIKYYKKLMLRRIDWQDTTRLGEGSNSGVGGIGDLQESDELMITKEPKENKCSLIWEGEVKERGFKGFWFKTSPTDNMAREYLKKHKAEHYWDLASKFTDELGELTTLV
ncbi:12828_t:CDS:10 [Entrophospora sp. SA101]|nr:12828_t:CDS:10 [Entrophospora sp. SA101]